MTFAPGVTSQVVAIPIIDNHVHGLDLAVGLLATAPGALATLGGVSSSALVIHENAPIMTVNPPTAPAPVTVASVALQNEVVSKHKKASVIVLHFSGALNAADAGSPLLYSLAPETIAKKHIVKLGKPVAQAQAVHNATTGSGTPTPKKILVVNPPQPLQINAAGLFDALGRPLDGNHDGQPGGNIIATLSNKAITAQRVRHQVASADRMAEAVDHLLEKRFLTRGQ